MSGQQLMAVWNAKLVLVSFCIGLLGSFTTLLQVDFAVMTGVPRERTVAAAGAALTMSISAIWSMHFAGMLAMDLPGVHIRYSALRTFASAAVAAVFCLVGVGITVRLTRLRRDGSKFVSPADVLRELVKAGAFTGAGVAAMHFIGMHGMIMPTVEMRYDPLLVIVSIAIAFVAATAAFGIFHYGSGTLQEQIVSSFVLAAAVCSMHYTAMASCSYYLRDGAVTASSYSGEDVAFGEESLGILTALVNCCFCFVILCVLTIKLRNSKNHLEMIVYERTRELAEQQARADALLYSLLPKHVAEILKDGGVAPNTKFDDASVLFMDICSFTSLCERSTPQQIVDLLNEVFMACDKLIVRYGLTKVDMIGDCLIVAGGIPVTSHDHVERLVDFAIDAIDAISGLELQNQKTERVQVRIGIACGPIVTGVIGLTMPHYSVFGDTVNLAARMEQSSEPNRIHFIGSPNHVSHLREHFLMTRRPTMTVKGKEQMQQTYWVDGRVSSHVPKTLTPAELWEHERFSLIGLRRRDVSPYEMRGEGMFQQITRDFSGVVPQATVHV